MDNCVNANAPPPPPFELSKSYHVDQEVAKCFSTREIGEIIAIFRQYDEHRNSSVAKTQLGAMIREIGMEFDEDVLGQVGVGPEPQVPFEQFLRLVLALRQASPAGPSQTPQTNLVTKGGQTEWSTHSYSQEEKHAFSEHINNLLGQDPHVGPRLPLDPASDALFEGCADGIIFCKMINRIEPDTVDERCLNMKPGKPLSIYHKVENLNLAIDAARSVGCQIVNVGAHDIMQGNPILILGLVWQLIKLQLLNNISLKEHPELVRLLDEGEELSALLSLPPDKILIRWVNFHLAAANSPRRIEDFGRSIQDCEVYSALLHQLNPELCPTVSAEDPEDRAKAVIANARALGISPFLQPNDIPSGNRKLNMAFVAQVFNQCPGLDMPTEDEAVQLGVSMDFATLEESEDASDSREERTFRNWINSLNMEDTYLNNLYTGTSEGGGLALIKVMDHVYPGSVNWKKVNKNPKNRFKKIENANYALKVGNDIGLILVNIGPYDLLDANKKLILAIIWQLMKVHTLQVLATLAKSVESVSEDAIVSWANTKVASVGRLSSMSSFKDKSLSNGSVLIELCFAVSPNSVNWDLVTQGGTDTEKLSNAKYAVSIARKIGASVFLIPEDIVEVRPKLLMTFVASLWVKSLESETSEEQNSLATDETKET